MTADSLIDEAIEDSKKDPRERTDVVKRRLIGFFNWLIKEAPKRKASGRGIIAEVGKGVSPKMAHTYVNVIRSFYGTFDIYVKLRGRSQLPKARVINRRMLLNNQEVKKLVDNARSLRDRVIILVMFQGGMDVSTLCSLKYGDVAEGLAKDEYPLKLELFRRKAGTEYYTFLGRDAINALKAYLNDTKARGLTLNYNSPLFLKGSHKAMSYEGIEPSHVQAMLKELAIKSGFVDEHLNGKDFNPLGPHALRESFGSIMTGKGVPEVVVDFWLGHEIGEMAEAYKSAKLEDLRQMYLDRERYIGISVNDIEQKLRAEIDEKNRQLQAVVNGLSVENLELKGRIMNLESHQRTVDHVLEMLDLKEEDAKDISEMIRGYRERKLKVETEAFMSD